MIRHSCRALRFVRSSHDYNSDILKFVASNTLISDSAVYKGKLYELTVQRELYNKLRIGQLDVVGGAHDGGVDIKALWSLFPIFQGALDAGVIKEPSLPLKGTRINNTLVKPLVNQYDIKNKIAPSIEVLVQCKAYVSKISPKEIRELAGTYLSLTAKNKASLSTIPIMCSPQLPTSSSLKLLEKLNIPFLYLRINTLRHGSLNDFELTNTGQLMGYLMNPILKGYLEGSGFEEWMKFELYNNAMNHSQDKDFI